MKDGVYRDMWVFAESRGGELIPVAKEMVSEARRLMDKHNKDYKADEKVVAVVLGPKAKELGEECIRLGADIAYIADHPELEVFRLMPATKVVAAAAQQKDVNGYDKPRYFLFPATNNGRDLSATVAGVLDTGLASDCNLLYIEDVEIKHKIKSGGEPKVFERILHMKRPDFSGFEWSTILCIDNVDHDYHPQCCSVIPGSFKAADPDNGRTGDIREMPVSLDANDLRVRVTKRQAMEKGVDLTKYGSIVAVGRGIGEDPTKGLLVGVDLAKALRGDLGLSRGVVTASYQVDPSVEQYVDEERQIGETGQFIEPEVYVALGISGAIQHKKGMDKSKFIVSVNTAEETPIKEFSDVYVVADLFEFGPKLKAALEKLAGKNGGGS
ncbi:MAG: electron transfer flavoprotein subunit alpha/FixB family protein [Euryarchaeota archaeon]|nr:electron transfer flavoprotein subunit alpha/FixB family protein [Euryarchaeota archaeon]